MTWPGYRAGRDPGELARADPAALRLAVAEPAPFLGFRLDRALRDGGAGATRRSRRRSWPDAALAVVREHPDVNVRKLYAGEVARTPGCRWPTWWPWPSDGPRRRAADRRDPPGGARRTPEVVVLALLLHRWDDIAPWLVEALFVDEQHLASVPGPGRGGWRRPQGDRAGRSRGRASCSSGWASPTSTRTHSSSSATSSPRPRAASSTAVGARDLARNAGSSPRAASSSSSTIPKRAGGGRAVATWLAARREEAWVTDQQTDHDPTRLPSRRSARGSGQPCSPRAR